MAKRYEHPDAALDLVGDLFTGTRRRGRPRVDDRLMLKRVAIRLNEQGLVKL
ncbi:hypothetical protein H8S56_03075 [Pseudomonas sp. DOAB1067]|uniref:Transposase n=1 Tax=Pseudomonas triticifolii TaxID=2762592 RepID=A0ABR7B9Z1_9PSED|nr:hypothetical protein [Pseudomonas triticifolii]MBC3953988.1 hypothetical protein [Pseudomonas triticifolii]